MVRAHRSSDPGLVVTGAALTDWITIKQRRCTGYWRETTGSRAASVESTGRPRRTKAALALSLRQSYERATRGR